MTASEASLTVKQGELGTIEQICRQSLGNVLGNILVTYGKTLTVPIFRFLVIGHKYIFSVVSNLYIKPTLKLGSCLRGKGAQSESRWT